MTTGTAESPSRTHPPLLRPVFGAGNRTSWQIAVIVLVLHGAVRFGGLSDPSLIPLSMAMIWPLPWLLSTKAGRLLIGLRRPDRLIWFVFASAAAVLTLVLCALTAWAAAGNGASNWFVHHALSLRDVLLEVPSDMSVLAQYGIVTGPALLFSPIAEEILFRGYLMETVSRRWSERVGMQAQAAAFALAHLAHFGLNPFDPLLILIWLPSMFVTAMVLGWVVRSSGSLWPAIAAHAVFNAAMNAVVFWQLPGVVGV